MSLFNKVCPSCGFKFRRVGIRRSFRCFGLVRKPFICPECGASLIWAKRPWRMSFGGMLVALALLPFAVVMGWDHSFEPQALAWAAISLLALLVACVGSFMMRFEVIGTANQTLQATVTPPSS